MGRRITAVYPNALIHRRRRIVIDSRGSEPVEVNRSNFVGFDDSGSWVIGGPCLDYAGRSRWEKWEKEIESEPPVERFGTQRYGI